MSSLPARPHLDQLKRQARELLRACRRRDPRAVARLQAHFDGSPNRLTHPSSQSRLHHAQFCLAREHGFSSWAQLKHFVELEHSLDSGAGSLALAFCRLVYAGDLVGNLDRAHPALADRLLEQHRDVLETDPWLACAIGHVAGVQQAISDDPAWVNRPGGPLRLPPLLAVTHSSLLRLNDHRTDLHSCAHMLVDAGADPNGRVGSRWPPASLEHPSDSHPLSVLYGAAGQNHDVELTRWLLERGADPNDGESLYHALDSYECTRLLLEAGARIAGTNAMARVFDLDRLDTLKLLLTYGGEPNEAPDGAATTTAGCPLLAAIRRRRSLAHVEALLAAGAYADIATPEGVPAWQIAVRYGLPEIADRLQQEVGDVAMSDVDRFIAACAAGEEGAAREIVARSPELLHSLDEAERRLLPELAAAGVAEAVRCMVNLGWPIAVRGGDWNASALNHAVFRGDADLADFLLCHGASWTEKHGYDDNVIGTLSWASYNSPQNDGDWCGCAEVLLKHGLPMPVRDAENADRIIVDGRSCGFSEPVMYVFLEHAGI